MNDATEFSEGWIRWRRRVDLDEYATRWARREAAGEAVHGEADFVHDLIGDGTRPSSAAVLDAGCGTGRVAIELARRGHTLTAVDNDEAMLAYARGASEPVEWVEANLADYESAVAFDAIVMAGNILVFARPGDRAAIVTNLARQLHPGGVLVNGSSDDDDYDVGRYDHWCAEAGLVTVERFGGWDREPYRPGGYSVSVHRRP